MIVFEKPKSLTDVPLHYCPGCTHGIVHRLVAEAMDTLDITGRTVGIASVGCSVFAYNYFACDHDSSRSRPRPGCGYRCQTHPSRFYRFHLSGRWRPGRHRHS